MLKFVDGRVSGVASSLDVTFSTGCALFEEVSGIDPVAFDQVVSIYFRRAFSDCSFVISLLSTFI